MRDPGGTRRPGKQNVRENADEGPEDTENMGEGMKWSRRCRNYSSERLTLLAESGQVQVVGLDVGGLEANRKDAGVFTLHVN